MIKVQSNWSRLELHVRKDADSFQKLQLPVKPGDFGMLLNAAQGAAASVSSCGCGAVTGRPPPPPLLHGSAGVCGN